MSLRSCNDLHPHASPLSPRQAAGTQQRIDRRVIQHIHKLVSQGVIHIEHMKFRMDEYVSQLFAGREMPQRDNRRYYPLHKDISNHIQKAMASLMLVLFAYHYVLADSVSCETARNILNTKFCVAFNLRGCVSYIGLAFT